MDIVKAFDKFDSSDFNVRAIVQKLLSFCAKMHGHKGCICRGILLCCCAGRFVNRSDCKYVEKVIVKSGTAILQ